MAIKEAQLGEHQRGLQNEELPYKVPPAGGGPFGRRRLGARQLGAVPFGRRTFGRRFELWRKNNEAGNSLNAVEREPVPTRVLNPNASEASYKPKQRSYRKTKLIFFYFTFFSWGFWSGGICRGNFIREPFNPNVSGDWLHSPPRTGGFRGAETP